MNGKINQDRAINVVINSLKMQRRILIDSAVSRDVIDAFSGVIRHLEDLSDQYIGTIVENPSPKKVKFDRETGTDFASKLSLDQIEKILDNESTTRVELEAIAIGRFHVPKGSMRSFKNVEQLREKVRVSVQNARTHESIAVLANKSS